MLLDIQLRYTCDVCDDQFIVCHVTGSQAHNAEEIVRLSFDKQGWSSKDGKEICGKCLNKNKEVEQ